MEQNNRCCKPVVFNGGEIARHEAI